MKKFAGRIVAGFLSLALMVSFAIVSMPEVKATPSDSTTKYNNMENAYDLTDITEEQEITISKDENSSKEVWFKLCIHEDSTVVFSPKNISDSFSFINYGGGATALSRNNFYDPEDYKEGPEGYPFETLAKNVFVPTNTTKEEYVKNMDLSTATAKMSFHYFPGNEEINTYYIVCNVADDDISKEKGFNSFYIRPYKRITGVVLDAGDGQADPYSLKFREGVDTGFTNHIVGLIPSDADDRIASVITDTEYVTSSEADGANEFTDFILTGKTGDSKVTINGIRSGEIAKYNVTLLADIKKAEVKLSNDSFIYDGNEKKPEVTVTLNGTKLALLDDYKLEYVNNEEPGTATVKVIGKNSYWGEKSVTFTIIKDTEKPSDKPTQVEPKIEEPEKTEQESKTSAPKVGDLIKTKKATYRITNLKKKEVELKAPANKKYKSFTVPATVKAADGTVYKVTKIADKAFYGNSSLARVTIGKNVASVGKSAFHNCKKLAKITINATNVVTVGSKAIKNIYKGCVIRVEKKYIKKYNKKFKSATGYKKTMKINKK